MSTAKDTHTTEKVEVMAFAMFTEETGTTEGVQRWQALKDTDRIEYREAATGLLDSLKTAGLQLKTTHPAKLTERVEMILMLPPRPAYQLPT